MNNSWKRAAGMYTVAYQQPRRILTSQETAEIDQAEKELVLFLEQHGEDARKLLFASTEQIVFSVCGEGRFYCFNAYGLCLVYPSEKDTILHIRSIDPQNAIRVYLADSNGKRRASEFVPWLCRKLDEIALGAPDQIQASP